MPEQKIAAPEKHTHGPWYWHIDKKNKEVYLRSSKMYVMGFCRYAMYGAQPIFLNELRLTQKAENFSAVVPGREHHADWYQTIDHPDARLIAAAPEMLEVITTVMRGPKNWNGCSTRPRSW